MNQKIVLKARKEYGVRIVGKGRGYVEAVRSDGLRIFLDGDPVLDMVRINAIDRKAVILAVAYRRAQQIAVNYAAKHAPDLVEDIKRAAGYDNPRHQSIPSPEEIDALLTDPTKSALNYENNRKG